MSLAYAHLAGLLKSDLASIEIELAVALRALDRGDAAAAALALAEVLRCARDGQLRQVEKPESFHRLHTVARRPEHQDALAPPDGGSSTPGKA